MLASLTMHLGSLNRFTSTARLLPPAYSPVKCQSQRSDSDSAGVSAIEHENLRLYPVRVE